MDAPYKIYNASAGSGKTYTLTKEYLKIILAPGPPKRFRNILAITFTNKAVNEMKGRILGSLFQFGRTLQLENATPMFLDIADELGISSTELQQKAALTLKTILHNYAFFDVSTIDRFTHRLIRTFARDLKLPQNFEVVLDTDLLLSEAVARLINKVGTEKELTDVMLDFALEKANGDKSWDIGLDLFRMGKLIFEENNVSHLQQIDNKGIGDFLTLKKTLRTAVAVNETTILESAKECMEMIEANGLEPSDFKSAYFPKFLLKILEGDMDVDFKAGWKQNFGQEPLYKKDCAQNTMDILDMLLPRFTDLFFGIRTAASQRAFHKNAYGNIVPLTLLNAIRQEVIGLQNERDQLPISSFNTIISQEIKDQPAPFIYERLGEKYRHYFIDEFQDTSEMQWNNLIPLIGNALEGEDLLGNKGSLFLVGDAKQAIYRWRGGKAEQFLRLIGLGSNPFVVTPHVQNLPRNYRSYEEVIRFNNAFFTSTSTFLSNSTYNQLFADGNKQEYNTKKGGLVSMDFIESDEKGTDAEKYFEGISASIGEALANGFRLRDICILTRKKKDGVLIANYLMENDIPLISSETLLLQNNPEVRFLIDLLMFSIGGNDREKAYPVLYHLIHEQEGANGLIAAHLDNLGAYLLNAHGFEVSYLRQHSVYDGLEYAIKKFDLAKDAGAYLIHLLDVALELETREDSGPQTFLAYWDKKKDSLSITAPENVDAVQIMTVHRSKGLEFPIVIFPFANEHIYKEVDAKLWLPVDKEKYDGFSEVLVSKKQEVQEYGGEAAHIYDSEQHKLELDAFNVLYVALTRAEQALFIITKKDLRANGQHRTDYYSGLFIHYLMEMSLWDGEKTSYRFGELAPPVTAAHSVFSTGIVPFTPTSRDRAGFKIITQGGSLWESGADKALEQGNIVHQLLGHIETLADMGRALEILLRNGNITGAEIPHLRETVLKIMNHPQLSEFYRTGNIIRNEREIITESGLILRPDRLVISGEKVTIMDYKTGRPGIHYHLQLHKYAMALEAMGLQVTHKVIVYINDTIYPEFI
ncbi:MAG: UvrD-helicase domain-containing protein [Sediminicola sp.]